MATFITTYTSVSTGRPYRLELTAYVSMTKDVVWRWSVMNSDVLFYNEGFVRDRHTGIGMAIGMADVFEEQEIDLAEGEDGVVI